MEAHIKNVCVYLILLTFFYPYIFLFLSFALPSFSSPSRPPSFSIDSNDHTRKKITNKVAMRLDLPLLLFKKFVFMFI